VARADHLTDVADDPIAAVVTQYEDEAGLLPSDVYEGGATYPVERFSLDEKATRKLAQLCALLGTEPHAFSVRLGRVAVDEAIKLGAGHLSRNGYASLIVGQDVADQLAADDIAARLKAVRAAERAAKAPAAGEPSDGVDTNDPAAAPSDGQEAERDRRRQERAEREERQRRAVAFNDELGAAVVKALSRVKVDDRVVRILAAVDIHGDLGKLAMRGARYGFAGWVAETRTKTGKAKVTYLDRGEAEAKAREYLAGAKTAADVAGRCLALVVMALYADEDAVANSNRSFHEVSVGAGWQGDKGLPWADEVVELIDEVAIERLPEHLTEQRAKTLAERGEDREERQAERERKDRERAEARARVDALGDDLSALGRDELMQAVADARAAYGTWSKEATDLEARVTDILKGRQADDEGGGQDESQGLAEAA
jgi:hypothetical protein